VWCAHSCSRKISEVALRERSGTLQ
jgi:hypothetical protein